MFSAEDRGTKFIQFIDFFHGKWNSTFHHDLPLAKVVDTLRKIIHFLYPYYWKKLGQQCNQIISLHDLQYTHFPQRDAIHEDHVHSIGWNLPLCIQNSKPESYSIIPVFRFSIPFTCCWIFSHIDDWSQDHIFELYQHMKLDYSPFIWLLYKKEEEMIVQSCFLIVNFRLLVSILSLVWVDISTCMYHTYL